MSAIYIEMSIASAVSKTIETDKFDILNGFENAFTRWVVKEYILEAILNFYTDIEFEIILRIVCFYLNIV